jgi:histidine triad (HIT) family protein
MKDSIFTKIVKGEIPIHKVYEDEKTLAFMDIRPIQPGHVLVIPKKQTDFVWNMDDEDYAALMATVQKVGKRIQQIFPEKKRVGVIIEGLDVEDHAHVKVFPFDDDAEFRTKQDPNAQPDHPSLAALAEKLAFSQ